MKLTITRVAKFTTNKEGQPLMTKTGKPYTSLRIQANEYGDKWISGFGNKENDGWKAGDTVEVEVEQKGEYLNFSMPKKQEGMSGDQYQAIMRELYAIRISVQSIVQNMKPGVKYPEPLGAVTFDPGIKPQNPGVDMSIGGTMNDEHLDEDQIPF